VAVLVVDGEEAGDMLGVFDSGSGGLTVLRALRERMPSVDIVYFGDLKNAPYGNKSREELGVLTVLGIERLIKEGATEIVSACNSVSVSIVLPMFEILDLPHANIVEMVGPTVTGLRGTDGKVLVVATHATIESHAYQDGLRMVGVSADGLALPDLVALIEGGASDGDMREHVRAALAPQLAMGYTHLLLGCTHFPLIRHLFDDVVREVDPTCTIVDPAVSVADVVARRFTDSGQGTIRFIVTQDSPVFRAFVQQCCGSTDPTIEVR
jgi:glutamate racemase